GIRLTLTNMPMRSFIQEKSATCWENGTAELKFAALPERLFLRLPRCQHKNAVHPPIHRGPSFSPFIYDGKLVRIGDLYCLEHLKLHLPTKIDHDSHSRPFLNLIQSPFLINYVALCNVLTLFVESIAFDISNGHNSFCARF